MEQLAGGPRVLVVAQSADGSDNPTERARLAELVCRIGGQPVQELGQASHLVLGAGLPPKLLQRAGRLGVHIVAPSWLQAVEQLGPAADYQAVVLDEHRPPALADMPQPEPRAPVAASLRETWGFLRAEHPDQVAADQLQRAIDNSLLDFAIRVHQARAVPLADRTAAAVLGVEDGADRAAVTAAYRRRALQAHPDRGGGVGEWLELQRAYKQLTQLEPEQPLAVPALPPAERISSHRGLVDSWFVRDGVDLAGKVLLMEQAVSALGLTTQDMCFYLSVARSYLRAVATSDELVKETALHLKRVIEAAVLKANPHWAGEAVGEHLEAFSDFLFFVIDSNALLSELAVLIFDSVSGGCEVFKGRNYAKLGSPEREQANLVTIRYVPGHYQALVPGQSDLSRPVVGPTLDECLLLLDQFGVQYITTDG